MGNPSKLRVKSKLRNLSGGGEIFCLVTVNAHFADIEAVAGNGRTFTTGPLTTDSILLNELGNMPRTYAQTWTCWQSISNYTYREGIATFKVECSMLDDYEIFRDTIETVLRNHANPATITDISWYRFMRL